MLRRRTPRFSRTRMNESSKVWSAKTKFADYGKYVYNWYLMYDDFEMTDELNDKIQNLMVNKNTDLPNMNELEKLLSDTFDTKMEINSCCVRSKSFYLSFIGRYVFFQIVVNF